MVLTITMSTALKFSHRYLEEQTSPRPSPQMQQQQKQIIIVPECTYEIYDICPAMSFFHNPEVHEAATESLMEVGRGLLGPADRGSVQAAVVDGLKNISFELQMHDAKVVKELNSVYFDRPQKDTVLKLVRAMSDPAVQSVGLDVGRAIHDSESLDRETLQRHIRAKLAPRQAEIVKLRDDVLPKSLRQAWEGGHHWAMTLDQENIRIMGPYHGEGRYGAARKAAGADVRGGALPDRAMKRYSILGGVLGEGRALFDIMKLCGSALGKDLALPYWETYLGGDLEVTSEFLSCEHHFNSTDPEDLKLNSTSALFCPLKFGLQGVDALRSSFDEDREGLSSDPEESDMTDPEVAFH